MPLIERVLPDGALSEAALTALMESLTRLVLKAEGASPDNKIAPTITWAFAHKAARLTVAGRTPAQPRYRLLVAVPEGAVTRAAQIRFVAEATEAILKAEGAADTPENALRVWCFF